MLRLARASSSSAAAAAAGLASRTRLSALAPATVTPLLAASRSSSSSPAERQAAQMNVGEYAGSRRAKNVKHFKIYRWNPDTKGSCSGRQQEDRLRQFDAVGWEECRAWG